MTRPSSRAREHVERRILDALPRARAGAAGSRLPWTPRSCADRLPAHVERDPPVEADHVAARGRQPREQVRGARCRSGSSARRPRRGCAPSRARRTPRSRRRRARRPRSRRAGSTSAPALDLRRDVARERARRASPSARARPRARAYISGFTCRKSRLGSSLDEVAGDGERAAAEADRAPARRRARRGRAGPPRGSRQRLLGLGHAQPLDVGARARSAASTTGPDALDELDVDAHAEDRRHDVGEQHGRVDAVPAHRLERHLRAELGLRDDLEERVPLADLAVLGQRAARPGA